MHAFYIIATIKILKSPIIQFNFLSILKKKTDFKVYQLFYIFKNITYVLP